MASNDSSAAVAAVVVNTVTSPLPQTENKTPEAAPANHQSQSKQVDSAAVPAAETLTPTPAADLKSELPTPSTELPPSNIPLVVSSAKDSSSQPSPSNPVTQVSTAAKTNTESTSNNGVSIKEDVKKDSKEEPKVDKPVVIPMEVDKEPVVEPTQTTNANTTVSKPSATSEVEKPPVPTSAQTAPVAAGSVKPPVVSESAKPPVASESDKPPVASDSDKPPVATGSEKAPIASGSDKPVPSVVDKLPSGSSSMPESSKYTSAVPKPVATIKPMVESPSSNTTRTAVDTKVQDNSKTSQDNHKPNNNKRPAEDGDEPEKRLKPSAPSGSKENKMAEQVLEHMEKTFDQRRKVITKQMPTIPELKSMYPELFMGKQLLLEFQRITKIDIDQKIQEFCVRYATAVIELARDNKNAAPVLARWERARHENENLKQYWDMVTALCLLPLHFGENFVEMVLEIEEDEEVKARGKIVPTLVARGDIFCTDEFFLIAENTIVQEFEEFTIAFASLYSSYWVFNMVYPETIENTYNYIQRCIVRQREPGAISSACKNFTKSLQKWNKKKEGK